MALVFMATCIFIFDLLMAVAEAAPKNGLTVRQGLAVFTFEIGRADMV